MANEKQEVQVAQTQAPAETEHTRDRRVFIPRVDIVENQEAIILTADMPGVNEKNANITLEKGILTILGEIEPAYHKEHRIVYAEYELGDYERSFTLSNEIDQNRIEASVENGVLKLVLPKIGPAKAKKIEVKAS
jgi:HSP20 family protein